MYGTVIGNSAHPEGFCQQTCNRCNYYCVPKNGRSAPATPARSSSRAPSSGCSDTPPDNQYSCAQQVYVGSLLMASWQCQYQSVPVHRCGTIVHCSASQITGAEAVLLCAEKLWQVWPVIYDKREPLCQSMRKMLMRHSLLPEVVTIIAECVMRP